MQPTVSEAVLDSLPPVGHTSAVLVSRATDDVPRRATLDLLLLGCGRVGQEVATLLTRRAAHLRERFGLEARIVAIADRSGFLLEPQGLDDEKVGAICRAKAAGVKLGILPGSFAGDATEMTERVLAGGHGNDLARPVLVDVSDADEDASGAYRAALRGGCDVVTANKKPLAGAAWDALRDTAREHGRLLRGEATVGAGLPVLDTLATLVESGDPVQRIEGCLSGTLGFVLAALEAGQSFCNAVDEAIARGYAEPDPVADLAGLDVARKALILGRAAGWSTPPASVELAGLVEPSLAGAPADELRLALRVREARLREQLELAGRAGRRLRFVAVVEPGRATAGLRAVPKSSPLAHGESTDNIVVFHTGRYRERPLTVSGPGAGVGVTALGVFADLLRVAAERRAV